ncbi:MAG: hypothetical protein L3J49_05305 [Desulfobulbaceae bacterium]|nr:hypothetical protein [Desulfobulbaceae bacterium]
MSEQNRQKSDGISTTAVCETPENSDAVYDPIEPRIAGGHAPILIEIICERVHCVLYDYAINTVDMIVDIFGDKVDIQTVIRQGDRKNAQRFMELCQRAEKMLTVPTILINGEVAFKSVPHPNELEKAIKAILEQQQ